MVCRDARHAKKALDMKVQQDRRQRRGGTGAFGACRLVSGSPGQRPWRHAYKGTTWRALLSHLLQRLDGPWRIQIPRTAEDVWPGRTKGRWWAIRKECSMLSSLTTPRSRQYHHAASSKRGKITRSKCAALDRRLVAAVRGNPACSHVLMTMPGIRPVPRSLMRCA